MDSIFLCPWSVAEMRCRSLRVQCRLGGRGISTCGHRLGAFCVSLGDSESRASFFLGGRLIDQRRTSGTCGRDKQIFVNRGKTRRGGRRFESRAMCGEGKKLSDSSGRRARRLVRSMGLGTFPRSQPRTMARARGGSFRLDPTFCCTGQMQRKVVPSQK